MSAKHRASGISTLSLSPDVKFMNAFKENKKYLNTMEECCVSQHHITLYVLNVKTLCLQSVIVHAPQSTVSLTTANFLSQL